MTESQAADTTTSAKCHWCGAEQVELMNGEWAHSCRCQDLMGSRMRLLQGDLTARMQLARWDMVPTQLLIGIRDAVDRHSENAVTGRGLWISGGVGTGKTMALALAGRALVTRHLVEVRYVNVVDLFNRMKVNLDQAHGVFEPYLVCDVLLLDDLGKEQVTEWKRELLYYLVDRRYTCLKPLWVATNLGGNQLEARCGEAIADRISEVCTPIRVTAPSMRRP